MHRFLGLIFWSFSAITIAQSHTELIVKNKIDHITTLAREPMVCEHTNGALFVTGYSNASDSPQLWKSNDLGKTWEKVNVGSTAEGAIGNSDVDLFIDKKGNIYLLSMTYTKFPENLEGFDFSSMKGSRITVGVSKDEGKHWTWQTISNKDYDDRPWISATTDGTLHIIWNDGKGVHHVTSKDEGETWQSQPDINEKGGSSFLASGYHKQLAVRVAPLSASAFKMDEGIDLVRLSLDNGKTWQDVDIPGNRTWSQNLSGIPRWVEPMVWDKDDKLYLLWSEGKSLHLGITRDNGSSWEAHRVVQSNDTLYFPYMKMSKQGLLCTWVSGFKNDIKHHAAVLEVADGVIHTHAISPQKTDIWSRFAIGDYQRATGGEYFPIIPLSNGNIGMVTTIQNSKANRTGFTWWELLLHKF
ncbi:MAG: sialidase family protein [Bacteroidota bacterium]